MRLPHARLRPALPDREGRSARGAGIARFGSAYAPLDEIFSSPFTPPVSVLLPARGTSAIDKAGQPFDDPGARRALHDAIKDGLGSRTDVREIDLHINDPECADLAAARLIELIEGAR